jgi:hypothetical protein
LSWKIFNILSLFINNVHLIIAQDVTGYPTLKFFKSGADSGVKYRGQRDLDSLAKFIEEQMGRGEAKEEKVIHM